uniref:Peptidase S1 domain-containing protein n=1 Tax=Steinernema glaseri TaxID=37863 RepID=A0A1I7YRS6_9BILA
MMFQYLLLAFVLLTVQSLPLADLLQQHDALQQHQVPTSDLVYGGTRAKIGDFPSQAYLRFTDTTGYRYMCGGTLISTKYVLTAAHCVVDNVDTVEAFFGTVNIKSPNAVKMYVRDYTLHPNYFMNDTCVGDDIAILELFGHVNLPNTNIQLAKFVKDDEELLKSTKAVISGFGDYKHEGNDTVASDDLLYAEVDLFSFNFCRKAFETGAYGDTMLTPMDMLCAGAKGLGVGKGDSGGPLHVRHNGELYQVGLASFISGGDAETDLRQDKTPAFFTRVSSYCDFIESATKGAAKCGRLNTVDVTSTPAVTLGN